ncbi:PREDICTED: zinc finger and SCAN domain-containing protein 18 isoform X2 [Rhinopithecus bieti]|uniref:zinc finger and SCAN domain-containing protein 18 isoform X2 n=1 Tax=Rhinopithecus bieti TaxID=61621 RepID=UPI00083C8F45|nr:PREDICTED: zinc finger and SCAN domain-containing protein 18 isoform X2 [Rhinopithecus bieti]
MLPLEKAFASPRSSPTPLDLPTPGSAAGVQQEEPETIPERTPADLEFSRLRFREFVYQEAAGPHQTLARLHELCRQWLMPEARSKEQMLELLVLEQFLGILPDKVRPWVVAQYPESCKKAASLVEGLADVLEEPGMLLGSPAGSSSILSDGVYERHMDPLLLPGELESASQAPGAGEIPAPSETPWLSPDSLFLEQRRVREARTEEASPANTEQKLKSFPEEPQHLEEWGHLDPAEENLKSYRKLLLWGYQLSQPDAASRLDTEELRLVERDPQGSGVPEGGRQQETAGCACEEAAPARVLPELPTEVPPGDALADPPSGTTEEEVEQPGKAPDPQDPQGPQDAESGSSSESQRQSVIQQPAPDRGAARLGTKRPHPEDGDGQSLEGVSGNGQSLEGVSGAGHSTGLAAGQGPGADEPGLSRGKPYACGECGEAFAWLSHLMEHHSSHGGRKRYACQGCWKTFHFSLALAEHQKTHEKEKSYALGGARGPQPSTREAQAGARAGGPPESGEGEALPAPPEAQR